MRRLLPLLLLAALPVASASAAGPPPRPHSRVATYQRDGIVVTRLQLSLSRIDGLLRGSVVAAAHNSTDHAIRRTVTVGRCTGGAAVVPTCPGTVNLPMVVPAHGAKQVRARVTIAQPPARPDAVEATVVPPGTKSDARILQHANAELLLKGSAWRGTSGGRIYGVQGITGSGAQRLFFDVPATSATQAYVDVQWYGSLAPDAATTLAKCVSGRCTTAPLAPARARSGPHHFGARTGVDIGGADSLALRATAADGTTLFSAALPWPG